MSDHFTIFHMNTNPYSLQLPRVNLVVNMASDDRLILIETYNIDLNRIYFYNINIIMIKYIFITNNYT